MHARQYLRIAFSLAACLLLSLSRRADVSASDEHLDFFESRIRPVLVEHCYECHSAESKILRGGLQLDSRKAAETGGDSGPAFVAGKPEESLLVSALKYESMEMPPKEKLSDEIIADFETWIRNGAVDPRSETKPARLQPVDWDSARKHWAFQPISRPIPPALSDSTWVRSPIDSFVLKSLRDNGMQPAPQASKQTLIRRATFDLTGLPPTVDEVQAFILDESPDSFHRVIQRLLDSPRYGERWGRHWLDLVRYATTNGADENHKLPNAWRYRDWVIRTLNADLPLDEFIVQQLAGDLLPSSESEQHRGDLLAATGMLVIGPKMLAEQDKDKMIIDIVDEQVDTISRTMLGLTIGCARCHDHKFDPIAASDYYALAGIFYSTQSMANREFVSKWMERPLPSKEIEARRVEPQKEIELAKAELEKLKSQGDAEAIKKQETALEQLEKDLPAFEMVMATQEGEVKDLPIYIRGNHLTPSEKTIPRGLPSVLTSVLSAPALPSSQSGRLEFAQWLVSPEHPLTARVMLNRIWMWHFGSPLMRSPSNWGLQAEPPSHPELMDWLSQELIHNGWSLKAMHRTIMLSATYQMSSQGDEDYSERDPENRLLWRQNRRRLEAEPVRDSILFVGGGLDPAMGGMADGVDAKRRAIYLPIDRAALYEMFSTFDYVETANHIEQRPVTTVPNQALFLMNSQLVHEQARQLAKQITGSQSIAPLTQTDDHIDSLFMQLYSRKATDVERNRAKSFLQQAEGLLSNSSDTVERRLQSFAALCRTLIAGNEFLYVE